MRARLGLLSEQDGDFKDLFSDLLDTMETLELDFNHFFRRLSSIGISDLETAEQRTALASVFFHHEGVTGTGNTDGSARALLSKWLEKYHARLLLDWENVPKIDAERQNQMRAINPKFIPRSWILDEVIKRVEDGGEREVLDRVMVMALAPFEESWGGDRGEEERWCGDVPRGERGMMCSCSS